MITGVVLARDEAANIVGCLESLRPHVAELILIDMESADQTVALARPKTDRVLSHPPIANFDGARNLAIPEAKFEWLWFIDADERVPAETGRLINQLVLERGHELSAITIPFKTYFAGKWIQHCGWWPGYTMPRVLKRGYFRFREKLHSGVEVNGPELRLAADVNLAIEHYSYQSVEHYIQKFNRYTSTEATNRNGHGFRPDWRRGIREMIRDLWMYYERNDGWRDGYHGWVLSWLAGQYRWFSEAKLLDLPNQQVAVAATRVPANLDEVFDVARHELALLRNQNVQGPLPVCFRSPLRDPSGYADDGRCLLKALATLDRPVSAREIRWSDRTVPFSETEVGLLKTLVRCHSSTPYISITNCIPTLCEPDSSALRNILRTTFETDRIPHEWLERLEAYDEIWVCSEHNRRAFWRSGVAPERLHVVPQAVDASVFTPDGASLPLPEAMRGRFVFLSVFDWQKRKGWDVLLRAYCQEFSCDSGVGLLLKISRAHVASESTVRLQAEEAVNSVGQTLAERPDIVVLDEILEPAKLASLYRSCHAFVLPTRGEGYGRPYLEALACGTPVIASTGSGQDDFLTDGNSWRVDTCDTPVSAEAAQELPIYAGHMWREPNELSLRRAMQSVHSEHEKCQQKVQQGLRDVRGHHTIAAAAGILESRLRESEASLVKLPAPQVETEQIRVVLEGELFASHSFSNINEQLATLWNADPQIALSIGRAHHNPTNDAKQPSSTKLTALVNRTLPGGPDVTIRHAFPPNFDRPKHSKWVHIQPWEFGFLPNDWVPHLRDEVDEIWAPSNYVRDVYLRSGVAADKIQVIPWGIDPGIYHPDIPPLLLRTQKRFRFLFVGGTIARKGFDWVLEAFLAEFSRNDDVCLVIKDVGTHSFYRYGNLRDRIFRAMDDPQSPEIIYTDKEMTNGQRASLYATCHCLVAPYRGEGFALPVLEGMACNLPPIIPRGGPTDDFCDEDMAFLLPARFVACSHDWQLCGPPTELSIELADLRDAMRRAFENQAETRRRGLAAGGHARSKFTWQQSVAKMTDRIRSLAARPPQYSPSNLHNKVNSSEPHDKAGLLQIDLSICVLAQNCESSLSDCLARVQPFVKEIVVGDLGSQDRTIRIVKEYGARMVDVNQVDPSTARTKLLSEARANWVLTMESDDLLSENELERVGHSIAAATPDLQTVLVHRSTLSRDPRQLAPFQLFRNRNAFRQTENHPVETKRDSRANNSDEVDGRFKKPFKELHARRREKALNVEVLFALGKRHHLSGNYFHSECYLSEALARLSAPNPLHQEALIRIIDCYNCTQDPYRAAEYEKSFYKTYDRLLPKDEELFEAKFDGSRLYLGAGRKQLSGYIHADVVPGSHVDVPCDLNALPWPWPDNSAELIVAEDLVEHLDINLIAFCNEAWRVLRPQGELFVRTPRHDGPSSWIDPTHRWHLHEQSFHYLDPDTMWGQIYSHYTDKKWEIVSLGVRGPQNILAVLIPRKS